MGVFRVDVKAVFILIALASGHCAVSSLLKNSFSDVILNPSLCHSEGAKRLKNPSFRVNFVKDLVLGRGKILRSAQNDSVGAQLTFQQPSADAGPYTFGFCNDAFRAARSSSSIMPRKRGSL
jgi:hypothetical protein